MLEITALLPKGFLERQGLTLEGVQISLERARGLLDTNLESVLDEAFHKPITSGKWSPAEIADHVINVNQLVAHALEIGLRRTEDASLEIVQMPRGRLTDDGRTIAPSGTEPTPGRPRGSLQADLGLSFTHLTRVAHDLNAAGGLGTVCVDQSFFGPMTGLECLQLIAWHTAHHARQVPITADEGV